MRQRLELGSGTCSSRAFAGPIFCAVRSRWAPHLLRQLQLILGLHNHRCGLHPPATLATLGLLVSAIIGRLHKRRVAQVSVNVLAAALCGSAAERARCCSTAHICSQDAAVFQCMACMGLPSPPSSSARLFSGASLPAALERLLTRVGRVQTALVRQSPHMHTYTRPPPDTSAHHRSRRPPRVRSRTALPAARPTPRCAYASGSDSLCAAGRASTAVSRTDADRRRACGSPRLRSEGAAALGTAQAVRRDSTAHLASCGSLANGPTNRTRPVKRPLQNDRLCPASSLLQCLVRAASQTSSRRIASAPRLGTTGWFCGTPMAKGKRGGRGAGGGAKGSSRQPAGGVIADNGGDSGESTLLPAPPPRECEPAGASPPVAPSGVGHGLLHTAGWTTASPDVTLVHHTHAQGSGSEASPKLQRWLSRVDAAAAEEEELDALTRAIEAAEFEMQERQRRRAAEEAAEWAAEEKERERLLKTAVLRAQDAVSSPAHTHPPLSLPHSPAFARQHSLSKSKSLLVRGQDAPSTPSCIRKAAAPDSPVQGCPKPTQAVVPEPPGKLPAPESAAVKDPGGAPCRHQLRVRVQARVSILQMHAPVPVLRASARAQGRRHAHEVRRCIRCHGQDVCGRFYPCTGALCPGEGRDDWGG